MHVVGFTNLAILRMWIKKVTRQGNALGVTLPVNYCRHFNIKRGDFVYLKVRAEGTLEVEKFNPEKRPDLAIMLGVEYDK